MKKYSNGIGSHTVVPGHKVASLSQTGLLHVVGVYWYFDSDCNIHDTTPIIIALWITNPINPDK